MQCDYHAVDKCRCTSLTKKIETAVILTIKCAGTLFNFVLSCSIMSDYHRAKSNFWTPPLALHWLLVIEHDITLYLLPFTFFFSTATNFWRPGLISCVTREVHLLNKELFLSGLCTLTDNWRHFFYIGTPSRPQDVKKQKRFADALVDIKQLISGVVSIWSWRTFLVIVVSWPDQMKRKHNNSGYCNPLLFR